jgi:hypothetical protein
MTPDDFRALDGRKQALRIPAMRLSIFLVPKASAPRIFTALRPPLDFILKRLTRDKALIRDYEKIAKRILAAAGSQGRPRSSRIRPGSARTSL